MTGGAGFIGSNFVASLNEAGAAVAVNDLLGPGDAKWRNLAKRQIADFVPPADLTASSARAPTLLSPPACRHMAPQSASEARHNLGLMNRLPAA